MFRTGRELFQSLLFIAREGLPLTSKGVIHKKQLSRLAGRLSIPEESLALLESSAGHQNYPLPVTLIIDLLSALGLITRDNSGYAIDRPMLQSWLTLTAQEMTDTLYTLIISRYGAPLPEEQHFRHLLGNGVLSGRVVCGRACSELDETEWSCRGATCTGKAGTDSGLKQAALAWIRLLAAFGWCELGSSAEGEECFRWKALKPQLTERSLGITQQNQGGQRKQIVTQKQAAALEYL